MKECDCVIGIKYDYDDTDLFEMSRLKRFIDDASYYKRKATQKKKIFEQLDRLVTSSSDPYLEIFEYCPKCGRKLDIDFEKIVDEVLGE